MTPVTTASLNVADRLAEMAAIVPDLVAVAEPMRRITEGRRVYRTVTFRQLTDDVDRIARGLSAIGVTRDAPGAIGSAEYRFYTLVFALSKSCAVQILIDPGMGNEIWCVVWTRQSLRVLSPSRGRNCCAILRRRFPRSIQCHGRKPVMVERNDVGRHPTAGKTPSASGDGIRSTRPSRKCRIPPREPERHGERSLQTTPNDPAAIIFTSGSTGPPKGVLYRHGNFDRQVSEIRDKYKIEPGEIDLACFALFGLFNAAMGVTTVLPRMDFCARPP